MDSKAYRVVSHDKFLERAARAAELAGHDDPVFMCVPKTDTYFMGCHAGFFARLRNNATGRYAPHGVSVMPMSANRSFMSSHTSFLAAGLRSRYDG